MVKAQPVNTPSFFERNKTLLIVGGIIVLLAFIILMWIAGTYNGLVASREGVGAGLRNIDVQYQRRADLIPNLVQVVAGYAKQERTVLEAVTEARAGVGKIQLTADDLSDPEKMRAYQEAQAQLSGSLSRLIAVAENYPDLKSNTNFLDLQSQLEGTENRIAVSRKDYNDLVKEYNVRVQRVPTNVVAGMFGFDKAEYFEADEGAATVPKIDMDQLVP
jgi:LemA protein